MHFVSKFICAMVCLLFMLSQSSYGMDGGELSFPKRNKVRYMKRVLETSSIGENPLSSFNNLVRFWTMNGRATPRAWTKNRERTNFLINHFLISFDQHLPVNFQIDEEHIPLLVELFQRIPAINHHNGQIANKANYRYMFFWFIDRFRPINCSVLFNLFSALGNTKVGAQTLDQFNVELLALNQCSQEQLNIYIKKYLYPRRPLNILPIVFLERFAHQLDPMYMLEIIKPMLKLTKKEIARLGAVFSDKILTTPELANNWQFYEQVLETPLRKMMVTQGIITKELKLNLMQKKLEEFSGSGAYSICPDRDEEEKKDAVLSSQQGECPICYVTAEQSIGLMCGDSYCHECLRKYILNAQEENNYPIKCPNLECNTSLSLALSQLQDLQWTREDAISMDIKSLRRDVLLYRNKMVLCADSECPFFAALSVQKNSDSFRCIFCDKRYCAHCRNVVGRDEPCKGCSFEADEAMRNYKDGDNKSKFMDCPYCRTWNQRIDGCSHVTCQNCKGNFDFVTGGPWTAESSAAQRKFGRGFHQAEKPSKQITKESYELRERTGSPEEW